MKYFQLRDRKHQEQFIFKWDYGDQNNGDYFTKHYPVHYHKKMSPRYIPDVVNNVHQQMTHIVNMYTQEIKSSYLQGFFDPVNQNQMR